MSERYKGGGDNRNRPFADSVLIEALYGRGGHFEQLSDIFTEYALPRGRSGIIEGYDATVPKAVFGQRVDDGGLISVTVGETFDTIAEKRWSYRVLLPSESQMVSPLHVSEHAGGRYINRPPIVRYSNGGITRLPHTEEAEAYIKLYLSTVTQAIDDLSAIMRT